MSRLGIVRPEPCVYAHMLPKRHRIRPTIPAGWRTSTVSNNYQFKSASDQALLAKALLRCTRLVYSEKAEPKAEVEGDRQFT